MPRRSSFSWKTLGDLNPMSTEKNPSSFLDSTLPKITLFCRWGRLALSVRNTRRPKLPNPSKVIARKPLRNGPMVNVRWGFARTENPRSPLGPYPTGRLAPGRMNGQV